MIDAALDFVAGVNLFHGLPLTRSERRRAVDVKLRLHHDWSDRRLAEELGVSRELVAKTPAEPDRRGAGPEQPGTDRRRRQDLLVGRPAQGPRTSGSPRASRSPSRKIRATAGGREADAAPLGRRDHAHARGAPGEPYRRPGDAKKAGPGRARVPAGPDHRRDARGDGQADHGDDHLDPGRGLHRAYRSASGNARGSSRPPSSSSPPAPTSCGRCRTAFAGSPFRRRVHHLLSRRIPTEPADRVSKQVAEHGVGQKQAFAGEPDDAGRRPRAGRPDMPREPGPASVSSPKPVRARNRRDRCRAPSAEASVRRSRGAGLGVEGLGRAGRRFSRLDPAKVRRQFAGVDRPDTPPRTAPRPRRRRNTPSFAQ